MMELRALLDKPYVDILAIKSSCDMLCTRKITNRDTRIKYITHIDWHIITKTFTKRNSQTIVTNSLLDFNNDMYLDMDCIDIGDNEIT